MPEPDAAVAGTGKTQADLNAAFAAAEKTQADLNAAFAAAKAEADVGKNALDAQRQRANDRSYIAKIIVWSFVILMVLIVVATTVGTYFFDWAELTEPATFLMTILSSVMLPVVTLVIGYYFGSEK